MKSERMSFASGSTESSSRFVSLRVSGEVGIVGRDMAAAETLTNGSRLVSGAILVELWTIKCFDADAVATGGALNELLGLKPFVTMPTRDYSASHASPSHVWIFTIIII